MVEEIEEGEGEDPLGGPQTPEHLIWGSTMSEGEGAQTPESWNEDSNMSEGGPHTVPPLLLELSPSRPFSALVLWPPSRGLLMERVGGRYRFVGRENEPTEGSEPETGIECDPWIA